MSVQRKNLLIKTALIAKEQGRCQQMVDAMREAAKLGVEFCTEEQELFYFAYGSLMKIYRSSIHFSSILHELVTAPSSVQPMVPSDIHNLKRTCEEVLCLLDDNLLPKVTDNESRVFYYKMKGDYYCYLAELFTGYAKETAKNSSIRCYLRAKRYLPQAMRPAHIIRLGLALNHAIVCIKMLDNRVKAVNIINQALDDALVDIHKTHYANKDVVTLVAILQKLLTLWIHEKVPPRVEPAPVDNTDAAPVDKTDAASVDKTDAASVDKTDAAPVDKTDAAPVDKTDAAPVDKTDAAPVDKTDAASVSASAGPSEENI